MPTNVLYKDQDMVEEVDRAYGTGRITYMPWVNKIIGAEVNHSNGKLECSDFKEVAYDLLQKFPEDKLAEVVKAASTEFAQANAVPREFKYSKQPLAVEFIISNLKSGNFSNVEANIINELRKQLDKDTYTGAYGNSGVSNNSKLVTGDSVVIDDLSALMTVVSAAQTQMKDYLNITDDDFTNVMIGYTSEASKFLNTVSGDSIGRDLFNRAFTSEKGEIPSNISGGSQYIELYYKPMIIQHHGAMPSLYNREDGKHGLSASSLFAYETAALEVEAQGAVLRVPFTTA